VKIKKKKFEKNKLFFKTFLKRQKKPFSLESFLTHYPAPLKVVFSFYWTTYKTKKPSVTKTHEYYQWRTERARKRQLQERCGTRLAMCSLSSSSSWLEFSPSRSAFSLSVHSLPKNLSLDLIFVIVFSFYDFCLLCVLAVSLLRKWGYNKIKLIVIVLNF